MRNLGMTHETAQRDPRGDAAIHSSGLRLVYSRDWPKERRMRAIARQSVQPIQPRRAIKKQPSAVAAPLLWAGEKMLKLMGLR